MNSPPFAVTWDYLCPFARNAHEHLVAALEAGAPWEVTFVPFSLSQGHVEEGGEPVWERKEKARGVLALEVGIVVRDRFPGHFLATHRALFAARHDLGKEIGNVEVLTEVLDAVGLSSAEVFAEIEKGWPKDTLRTEHERAVATHQVFGVPTFILGDDAVFVRLMDRPKDAFTATESIEGVLTLLTTRPQLNEYKHTSIRR